MFGIHPRPAGAVLSGGAETPPDGDLATVDFFARRGVALTRVASSGWLIRATATPAPEPSVLGCVQDHGSEFELMELEGGFHWSTHGSLHSAVAHLLTDARVLARLGGGPYPVPAVGPDDVGVGGG